MEAHAMNSITQNHQDEELLSKKMQVFFRRYQVSRILRAANAYKLRGVPVLSIFLLVFRMVFQQRSVYTQMHLQRTAMPFGKDTFYRFMNSCRIHWRRFTTELAAAIIHATLAPLTQADRINVLILDDSICHRARSKKVELLARLYDHAKKEFSYGFRMLTLCWSDGNTLQWSSASARMHEVWGSCSTYLWMSCRMCASWKPCTSFFCCLLNDSKRSLCWMKGRSRGSCKAS